MVVPREKWITMADDMNRIAFSVIFGFSLVTTALTIGSTGGDEKMVAFFSLLLAVVSFIFFIISYAKQN